MSKFKVRNGQELCKYCEYFLDHIDKNGLGICKLKLDSGIYEVGPYDECTCE